MHLLLTTNAYLNTFMSSKKLAVLTDEVLLYYRRYILSNIYIYILKFIFVDFFVNFSIFLYKYKINIPIYLYICMYNLIKYRYLLKCISLIIYNKI